MDKSRLPSNKKLPRTRVTYIKKLKITVTGPQAGCLLADYFGDPGYEQYNHQTWERICYEGEKFDLDQFRKMSLNYDAAVQFAYSQTESRSPEGEQLSSKDLKNDRKFLCAKLLVNMVERANNKFKIKINKEELDTACFKKPRQKRKKIKQNK
jgi:hypothetical protein